MIKEIKEILDSNSITNESINDKNSGINFIRIPIDVSLNSKKTSLNLELMFVEGMEEATSGLSLLQFFVTIDLEISSEETTRVNLMKFISKINHTLAAGSFYLYPNENFIYFKYNMCVVKEEDSGMDLKLTRTIWLIKTQLNNYFKEFSSINQMNPD